MLLQSRDCHAQIPDHAGCGLITDPRSAPTLSWSIKFSHHEIPQIARNQREYQIRYAAAIVNGIASMVRILGRKMRLKYAISEAIFLHVGKRAHNFLYASNISRVSSANGAIMKSSLVSKNALGLAWILSALRHENKRLFWPMTPRDIPASFKQIQCTKT